MLEKNEDLKINDIIKNSELTAKAKFLYVNGFFNEPTRVEKIDDSYADVTYNKGFKGLIVLEKSTQLFLAKPQSEEDNVYSYDLYELHDVSETQYQKLKKLSTNEQFKLFKILTYITYGLTIIIIVSFLFSLISLLIDGATLDDIIYFGLMAGFPSIVVAVGICGLLSKK